MDTQALYELADREIRLGTYDRAIMAQAKQGARGIEAVMHQRYWQLRAEALRLEAQRYPDPGAELYLRELVSRLDREAGGRRLRANVVGWMWVVVCLGCFGGAAVCFWAARAAFVRSSDALYAYGGGGICFVVLAVVAYIVTKRDAGHDPFAD